MSLRRGYGSCALAVLFAMTSFGRAQEINLPKDVQARQSSLPDTVLYGVLFRQAAAFKEKADELDRVGMDSSPFRKHLAHKLNLSATQVILLDEAALQYTLQVKPIEAEIAESAARFHEANRVAVKGHLPPLPPEAASLIARRESAIASVRDRFHTLLGDQEFARVENYDPRAGVPWK